MKSILAIGHSTFDTFLKVDNSDFKIDPKNRGVCFLLGSKVNVKEIHYGVGGSAANVAVGVSKLRLQTSIYTIIGNDMKGMDIISVFKKNQVSSQLLKTDRYPTNQSSIISYDRDRTIFSYHHEREYSLKGLELNYDYVFLGSTGEKVADLYSDLIEIKKKSPEKKLFFNPGGRELNHSRDDVLRILPYVDYFISNVEEACLTVNSHLRRDQVEINDLMKMIFDLGAKNVLITDGDQGVSCFDGYKNYHYEAMKVEMVEKTGAGDAFTAGFIGGISVGLDISKAAQWGNLNSASTIQKYGAQNGLLTLDEIIELSGFKK